MCKVHNAYWTQLLSGSNTFYKSFCSKKICVKLLLDARECNIVKNVSMYLCMLLIPYKLNMHYHTGTAMKTGVIQGLTSLNKM